LSSSCCISLLLQQLLLSLLFAPGLSLSSKLLLLLLFLLDFGLPFKLLHALEFFCNLGLSVELLLSALLLQPGLCLPICILPGSQCVVWSSYTFRRASAYQDLVVHYYN